MQRITKLNHAITAARSRVASISAAIISSFVLTLVLAGPGRAVAQNPDVSQPQSAGQGQYGQDQGQSGQDQNNDQDMSGTDSTQGAPYDQNNQTYPQAAPNDQNERPPMSEEPPPLKPSPNIMGPGPMGPRAPIGSGPGTPMGSGPTGTGDQTASNNGVARLSMIHGDVSTRRGDSGEWSAAQVNAPVIAGDSVSTGDKSRVELQLDYANILRLAEHTQANISSLTRSKIQIQMGHGMANYTVLRNSDADAEIDTPNVSIRSERRESSFRILVTADDHTEVLVRRGEVEITTPQGGTRVGENQFITIRGNGADTQYRIGEAPARDDWDQWNTDRDRMINGSMSRKNTNGYYTGTQDLDANGSWQSVPDYGQAWFPNEPQGWVPYSAGAWVWEPYWGWTWVSSEPWGWAPYHYGRWFQYNGAWGWWPGPVYPYYRPMWAPAYVSFFGFGGGFGFGWGSIGWFPIGPCDFFHPWWGGWGGRFGYTGWGGWNRGGFAPLHGGARFSNVNRAMHDANFRGATSVAANRFGQGRTTFSPVSHAAMQGAHLATGNLPVTPTRASLSASGRPAAASTLGHGGANHFFSSHGTSTAASGRSFEQERTHLSNAMRQSGVSPVNGARNESARNAESARGENGSRGSSVESNRETARAGNGSEGRTGQAAENRGQTGAGHEGGAAKSGGWQKFTPMTPRSSAPSEGAGRSSSSGSENRSYNGSENRSYNNGSQNRSYNGSANRSYGSVGNRGSYGAPRGGEERGYGSGYPGAAGRSYGGGAPRPQLNMRQPIVTPRSSGSARGGSSYGGRAPSFGGHSSGGGSHGGGSSHGGGGGHGGGHR